MHASNMPIVGQGRGQGQVQGQDRSFCYKLCLLCMHTPLQSLFYQVGEKKQK